MCRQFCCCENAFPSIRKRVGIGVFIEYEQGGKVLVLSCTVPFHSSLFSLFTEDFVHLPVLLSYESPQARTTCLKCFTVAATFALWVGPNALVLCSCFFVVGSLLMKSVCWGAPHCAQAVYGSWGNNAIVYLYSQNVFSILIYSASMNISRDGVKVDVLVSPPAASMVSDFTGCSQDSDLRIYPTRYDIKNSRKSQTRSDCFTIASDACLQPETYHRGMGLDKAVVQTKRNSLKS